MRLMRGSGVRTGEKMNRRSPAAGSPVVRFTAWVRVVHWVNAVAMLTLIATGSSLYIRALAIRVGHRGTVKAIHVWVGLALTAWWLLVLLRARTSSLGRELRELDGWTAADTAWLLTGGRMGKEGLGKYNAGQKLNAALLGGLILCSVVTGLMMKWHEPFPDWIRTGATFVHDVSYLIAALLIVGHIVFAVAHPVSMRAMLGGSVPVDWAISQRPRWAEELDLVQPGSTLGAPDDEAMIRGAAGERLDNR